MPDCKIYTESGFLLQLRTQAIPTDTFAGLEFTVACPQETKIDDALGVDPMQCGCHSQLILENNRKIAIVWPIEPKFGGN